MCSDNAVKWPWTLSNTFGVLDDNFKINFVDYARWLHTEVNVFMGKNDKVPWNDHKMHPLFWAVLA